MNHAFALRENKPKQSQFQTFPCKNGVSRVTIMIESHSKYDKITKSGVVYETLQESYFSLYWSSGHL